MNVVDTPGFGDTDKDKRERNSQRVAQALTFGINAFFLVQKGEMTRFGEQEQEILGYLHQWTNGAFWNRLIILDRASFNYESLYERSIKDRSYWFESQTTDVEAIKRLILDAGKKQNWTIRRNGRDIPLSPHDLEGIKRLPFDAKQTIFCDKVRPGCTPVTARKCSNPRFRQSCYKMPIWEDEVSIQVLDSKMVNLIIDKMMMICIMKMNMKMFFFGKMFRHVENRRFFSTNSSKS